jgi:hypothetical protein
MTADLFADFGLIGADRFNILLLQNDVIGSARQVKYSLLRRWLARRHILHQNGNILNATAELFRNPCGELSNTNPVPNPR